MNMLYRRNQRWDNSSITKIMITIVMTISFLGVSAGNVINSEKYKYPSHLHEIRGWVVEQYDEEWYFEQYVGWLDQAIQNPKDEHAWLNCFLAKNYELMSSEDDIDRDSVFSELLNLMEMYIPDTYTYHACNYMGLNRGQPDSYASGRKAFEMLPKKKTFFDYDTWVSFLYLFGDKEYSSYAKEYYNAGIYSKELIQFNLNELNCMEEGAIFVGNGDVTIIPKWLIQEGMGKHRDKLLICYSYLYNSDYRKRLYDQLGIGDVPELSEDSSWEEYERYIQTVIDEIAVRTGRKLYMSKYNQDSCHELWKDRNTIYDIGLVYQVSPNEEIDIFKEQERVFNNTDFSYLDKTIKKNAWIADSKMSYTIALNSSYLIFEYKRQNNEAGYKKMLKLAEKATKRISNDKWREKAQEIVDYYKNDEIEEIEGIEE